MKFPESPEEIFENEDTYYSPQKTYISEDIVYDNGIFDYRVGFLFPQKGHSFTDSIRINDLVKKLIIESVKNLKPNLALAFLSKKYLEKVLKSFITIVNQGARDTKYFLRYEYLCPASQEIWTLTSIFLYELGISPEIAQRVGHIIASVFQWDFAYRYPLQDAFRKDPIETIDILISRWRQIPNMNKMVLFKKAVKIAFLFPRIRKAFKTAVETIDLQKIKMDEADEYNALFWTNYDYAGIPAEENWAYLIDLHKGKLPPQFEIMYN